jgi:hypothetical protein
MFASLFVTFWSSRVLPSFSESFVAFYLSLNLFWGSSDECPWDKVNLIHVLTMAMNSQEYVNRLDQRD